MPLSGNRNQPVMWGSTCYPDNNTCSLPYYTTIPDCENWAFANGLNVIGVQDSGECYGCNNCDYTVQGVSTTCTEPLGCSNVSQVYVFNISPPPPPPLWAYQGCFNDAAAPNRTIPFELPVTVSNVADAQTSASQYNYTTVGIQYGGQVWVCNGCNYSALGSASNCSELGGYYAQQVYTKNV